jgi:DNA-directed RNA polymerase subunit RPC12/RpoP
VSEICRNSHESSEIAKCHLSQIFGHLFEQDHQSLKTADYFAVPGTCSRYFEENFDENEEIRCQNCFKMLEHLKVRTSEIKSAQLTNKILLEELKHTGGEYKIDENLSTYEKLNSQSKAYPLSES